MVPAFNGLGAPYWDMHATGLIIGITRDTNNSDIIKATLDSIAYQTKDVLISMENDVGSKINTLNVDGGASNNNYLMQFQSDILGINIKRPKNTELTALGAGYIAGLKPAFWDIDHLKKLKACVDKGRSSSELTSDFTMTAGLPSFISDDMDLAVQSAIKGLSGYARLPFYQRVLKLSGYEDIVNSIEGGANPAEALTPELVSDLALVGPIGKCKETLAKFADAGADMPIITPNPVGKQSPLEVMEKIIEVIK